MNYSSNLKFVFLFFILLQQGVWGQDYSVIVDSGYVFIDGEYIEPPYIINIKNNDVYINGKCVFVNGYEEFNFKQFDELLSLPFDVSEIDNYQNLMEIKSGNVVTLEKWVRLLYLTKFPYSEACSKIKEFYSQLTFVDSVNQSQDGTLSVYFNNNKKNNYRIEHDREFLLDHRTFSQDSIAEFVKNSLVRLLRSGDVKSYARGRGEITMSRFLLFELIEALECTSHSPEYKQKLVERFIPNDKNPPNYFNNYDKLLEKIKRERNAYYIIQ